MFDAISQGFAQLMNPPTFGLLFLGVLLGMWVGVTPGMTGSVSMAILLPIIWGMSPAHALALLIGLLAVMQTTDTIPAVMFGIPSNPTAAATALDGYAMAKRGEAARALGAAFSASMLGGIFGAICLSLSVPIATPLLRQFLSPEYFMLCLLGVALVGGLTGAQPLKGLFAGGLGLMLAVIGGAPGVGHNRFTFGQLYLGDGLPLIVVIMGLMALPEFADLFIKGTQIADVPKMSETRMREGLWQGYRDTFKNWWLLLRSSAIGAWIGFAPGVGGAAGAWMAYSHAVASIRDGRFGKGDVRGVIAPESSNNAVLGGDLIPTLLFGIPGSGLMAIFLAGLYVIGVNPGPDMVGKNLPFLYTIAWSLAIANVMATLMCTALARAIARLSTVKIHYIIPFILVFVIMGAYQSTRNWGDLVSLFIVGALGWTMKRLGWPRPPLLVGFVLGSIAEYYLYLSYRMHGITWLWRPWVLVIFAAMIASLVFLIRRKPAAEKGAGGAEG